MSADQFSATVETGVQTAPEGETQNGNIKQGDEHKEEVEPQADPTNLIVNYIPVTLTEEALRSLFAPYGNIQRCKIVNDRFTGMSLGYGFVKFETIESAQSAVAALNSHQLQNKRLKVSVSKPPEKEKKTNLYISGLPSSWTQVELEQLVSQFGKILEVRVLYDLQTRKCKGVGFARFETQKSALACINALTGTTVDGGIMPLIVKYADTTSDKVRKAMASGNYGHHVHEQYVNPAFYGGFQNQQQSMYTPQNPQVQAALQQQALQNTYRPQANAASPPQPAQQANGTTAANGQQQEFTGVCLFVYHLPLEATESTLFQLFGNYGVVTSAKVMRDLLTGRSKGFGFVNLLNEQQAQAAINGLNGFQLGSKYLKVAFKK